MGFFSNLDGRIIGTPSILSADFANLADDVHRARDGGAGLIHFDVMDNHFVPNLTVGPAVANSLVLNMDLPVDAHLQILEPDNLIPAFIEAGVASISVQPEVVRHLHRTLGLIHSGGCEAGIALNPTTPLSSIDLALPFVDYVNVMTVNPGFGGQDFIPQMTEKIRNLRQMTDLPIQVDGGITEETAPMVVEAGAQVLVAGSAVFKGDPAQRMQALLSAARKALPGDA